MAEQRKLIRVSVWMEQVPLSDIINHIGENIWYSPNADCIVTHGPFVVGLLHEKPVLLVGDLTHIEVSKLHLSSFWQIWQFWNDPSKSCEQSPKT